MKAARFGLIAILLVGGAVPTFGQSDENPPSITDMTFEIARNTGLDPFFGPFEDYVAFDPVTELAREGDRIRVTVSIVDADLPEDDIFVRKQSVFMYRSGYPAPEPPPVGGDSFDFRVPFNLQVGAGTATAVFQFVLPEWMGPNQARLRGYINWDVHWFVIIEVTNEEDPSDETPIARDSFTLRAVEHPSFLPANPPPAADAGPDMTVVTGSTVELDGTRTFDATNIGFDPLDPNVFEKDVLTYTWEWISGPERVEPISRDPVNAPAKAEVTFNQIGTYEYRLTVDDNVNALPSTDSVIVTVVSAIPENQAPTAVIDGPTADVVVGTVIMLDGTGSSDPDGDPLSFRWRQTDELGGNLPPSSMVDVFQPLGGLETPISSWQAVKAGTYYFRLLVDDGELHDDVRFSLTVVEPGAQATVVDGDSTARGQDGASESMESGAGEEPLGPMAAPLCGGGLLPLALLPLALLLMRGRLR